MQQTETLAPQKLDRGDRLLLGGVAAAVLFSALFVGANYRSAFPQASLQLTLSREQITAKALEFLKSRNLDAGDREQLTLFDPNDEARLFLEREAGLEEANRILRETAAVWRWRARWFRPGEQEEFRVWLTPEGRLAGFQHVVPEAAAGPDLGREAAFTLALDFLKKQTPVEHELVEENAEKRPSRTDYVFTWKQPGFALQGSEYRRTVTVQGGAVGAYDEYVHIPESWRRDFAALRSKNNLYSQIAQFFYIPLMGAAAILLLIGARRRQIRWHSVWRISAVVGGLMTLAQLNNLPFTIDAMPTSASRGTGLALAITQAMGAGVGVFLYVYLAAAPGEWMYRRGMPGFLTLGAALSRHALSTREFFRATLAGYGFAALHLAWLVAFYLIGKRFGVWSPQDIEYSDLLSTRFPWVYPLSISVLAAVSEEFWFRLFAIPWMKRWARWLPLAIGVPAFVWGFLHANYPQQPGYIRGVEVGLLGVGAGIVMLRFGILATLVWHYTIDAVLIGSFLLSSESWYFRLSGMVVGGAVLFPFAMALIGYWRRGGFAEPLAEWRNVDGEPVEVVHAEAAEEDEAPTKPEWGVGWLYVTVVIACAAAALVNSERAGAFLRAGITREAALQAAGTPPEGWIAVASFEAGLDARAAEFLRRQVGMDGANRILEQHDLNGLWRVRWFRPQDEEERIFYIGPAGRIEVTDHAVSEKAPGANLDSAAARAIAVKYLRGRGLDPERWQPVDNSANKRPARTDHELTWEIEKLPGGAAARASLTVQGDEPTMLRRYIHLPEAWVREFTRPRLARFLFQAILGGTVVILGFVFLKLAPHADFRWRRYLAPGLIVAAVTAVAEWNALPQWYRYYDTSQPLGDYTLEGITSAVLRTAGLAFVIFLAAFAGDVFRRQYEGSRRLRPASIWRMFAVAGGLWAFSRLAAGLRSIVPGERFSLSISSMGPVDAALPWLDALTDAVFAGVAAGTIGLALVAGLALMFSPARRVGYLVMGAAFYAVGQSGAPLVMGSEFAIAVFAIAVAHLYVNTCGADPISFGGGMMMASASAGAHALLAHGPFKTDAWIAAVGAVVIGIAVAIAFRASGGGRARPELPESTA